MRIAILSPVAWRTPSEQFGSLENIVSDITEELVKKGIEVTLFATKDSRTKGKLHAVNEVGFEEDNNKKPDICQYLHVSEVFEKASEFDLIHNHMGYYPVTYSKLVETPVLTTIYEKPLKEEKNLYKKYSGNSYFAAISEFSKMENLFYMDTIYQGVDLNKYDFNPDPDGYLLFAGNIEPNYGTKEAIMIAQATGLKLMIAGTIENMEYFEREISPHIDGKNIVYIANVSTDKVSDLFGNARALLNPINTADDINYPSVLSLACGTPVVAFNRGAMDEIIDNGTNGYLVSNVQEAIKIVKVDINNIDRKDCRNTAEEKFDIKKIADQLLALYDKIIDLAKVDGRRPWGYYIVMNPVGKYFKTKQVVVYPGKRLSKQYHSHRSEHWYFLKGEAVITIDDKDIKAKAGDMVDIPVKAVHRIENCGDEIVEFIEVQKGDYLGEDDIERIEDDYGRDHK